MSKDVTLHVRIPMAQKWAFEVAAAKADISLSNYVRSLIERGLQVADLGDLRASIDALRVERRPHEAPGQQPSSVEIETLLLMRLLCTPQNLGRVHEMLRSMDHEPFHPGGSR